MNKTETARIISPQEGRVTGGMLGPVVKGVHDHLLRYQWQMLNDEIPGAEPSHCIDNFRLAAGVKQGEFYGMVFQDSDFGKWIEALGYKLMTMPDPELEQLADETVDLLEKAQREDGYLDTYFICNGIENRWTNLRDCHELYCAGHLLEGAIAYYQATGKRKMLDIMIRYTDHIHAWFTTKNLRGFPGHAEIELALCKLADLTGEQKYLELAQAFIDRRGLEPYYFDEEQKKLERPFFPWNNTFGRTYAQAHLPVRQQFTVEGHAVRALYLASGAADVALRTGDTELWEACKQQFMNMIRKRMYVTGGVGSTYTGEAFTFDYDLPDDTAYAETCASVALIFFAHRMLLGETKGIYADAMESALYNTCLSGMSLDMKCFFYVNALSVFPEADEKDPNKKHVVPERQPWLGCACCPPNLARLLCSLITYQYTVRGREIQIHLFAESELNTEAAGQPVHIAVHTDYPRNGLVRINTGKGDYDLRIHLPGWCPRYTLLRNGKAAGAREQDGYLLIRGPFEEEELELELEMIPRRIHANDNVRSAAGKVAVALGPVVYCAEEADNGPQLHMLQLARDAELKTVETELLGGTTVIEADACRTGFPDQEVLYFSDIKEQSVPVKLRLIPYYKWANRGKDEMQVWIRES